MRRHHRLLAYGLLAFLPLDMIPRCGAACSPADLPLNCNVLVGEPENLIAIDGDSIGDWHAVSTGGRDPYSWFMECRHRFVLIKLTARQVPPRAPITDIELHPPKAIGLVAQGQWTGPASLRKPDFWAVTLLVTDT